MMSGRMERFDVLGVGIDALSKETAIACFRKCIEQQIKTYVIFCTVSSVLSARSDPHVARAFNEAGMVAPDGMPLVWLGRRQDLTLERVYGPTFMLDLMAASGGDLKHFFYGGMPGVTEKMVSRLCLRFPELQIAGYWSPPFSNDLNYGENEINRINRSGADVVWVGLGHPKQELWMQRYRPVIEAPVLAGVGAAFDFHSGEVREAPLWMQNSGLQWLHRLSNDPKRLWRRYLIGNSKFVALLVWEKLKGRSNKVI